MLVRSGGREGAEAVVVLGYRNRRPRINTINKSRVRIGVRSIAHDRHGTRVIFSGGATAGGPPEAQLMADCAKSALGFDGRMLVEDQSRSTWENVTNVIPLIESADRVKIASQPGHARKARPYLRRQRPDLAAKLVSACDYRVGEWSIVKPLLAAYGLWTLRGLSADERSVTS
ncbi:MAG TPA: YdcF family protein [Jatrophihabitans sp.]|nr:YdcF family protein [Jatrophihabitans sp.]